MRSAKSLLFLSLLGGVMLLSLGCIDPRMKREISLTNVMVSTAAEEFKKSTTDGAKLKVAQDYFEVAPAHTQVIEDYAFGRKPAEKALVIEVTP